MMQNNPKISWLSVWNELGITEEPHEILARLKEGK